jgi:hypothetical protein
MKKEQALSWGDKQKALDEESREMVREWERQELERKIALFPPDIKRVHEEFNHDPKVCRCFGIVEKVIGER